MTGTENLMIGQAETRGNRQGLNGEQVNNEETNRRGGRLLGNEHQWRRADAGVSIKAPHHALTVITENSDPSLVT
jgi:hypothetical protein